MAIRIRLDKTLYEPLECELPDGRVLTTVPFTPPVLRAVQEIERARKEKELDSPRAVVKQISLLFGAEETEVETIDSRILNDILTLASERMSMGKVKASPADVPLADVPANAAGLQDPATDPGPAPDPAGDEKNESRAASTQ